VTVGVGVCVGVEVIVGVGVSVAVGVEVGVEVGVGLGVSVAVGDAVGVKVGLGRATKAAVGEGADGDPPHAAADSTRARISPVATRFKTLATSLKPEQPGQGTPERFSSPAGSLLLITVILQK
jgi:hypothetical protein